MAARRTALAFVLLESVLAATTTPTATASRTSIFLPGFDQQSLVASVITASPSATTYFVQCGSEDQLDCGVGNGELGFSVPYMILAKLIDFSKA